MREGKDNSNLINKETLLLEPVFIDKVKTRIFTIHGIYYSNKSPLELLENACILYASTFEGRQKALRKLMNYSVKPPLLIEPPGLGAFPTMSYRRVECVWIFNHPFYVDELEKGKSIVHFMNGTSVTVHTSKNVLLKQHQRLHTSLNIYSMNHRNK